MFRKGVNSDPLWSEEDVEAEVERIESLYRRLWMLEGKELAEDALSLLRRHTGTDGSGNGNDKVENRLRKSIDKLQDAKSSSTPPSMLNTESQ